MLECRVVGRTSFASFKKRSLVKQQGKIQVAKYKVRWHKIFIVLKRNRKKYLVVVCVLLLLSVHRSVCFAPNAKGGYSNLYCNVSTFGGCSKVEKSRLPHVSVMSGVSSFIRDSPTYFRKHWSPMTSNTA